MKNYTLTIFAFLFVIQIKAVNYYFSNLGDDDLNSGISISEPYKTLDKLNTLIFSPGDSILFRCGDTFRGEINLNQGGNQFANLVISFYGTGPKPIISGAVKNDSWNLVNSIYQSTISDSVGNFFVADKEKTLARYPNNDQYLTIDSASAYYLKDQSIISENQLFLEGNICIHTAQWCWEKTKVLNILNDKISYTDETQIPALAGYSYFLYNSLNHLDIENEWFYDDISSTLYFKSEGNVNPNSLNCESSIYKNGINLFPTVSYVTITGISFEKQLNSGVNIYTSSNKNIVINECDFAHQYNHGVNDKGRLNEILNSNFREIDGIAVFVNATGFKSTIHHNTFRNIGQYRNSGIGTQINLSAIKCAFVDSCYVHHNNIDSTGYCGISADGGYNLIERNIIKHAMLLNNDGAALKGYGAQTHHSIFRNNFVSESTGNTSGTQNGNFITPAIYFDFLVNNCLVENNTVFNQSSKGIFQNSGNSNNTIRGNVIYGSKFCLDLNGNLVTDVPMTGMNVKNNTFFALDNEAYLIREVDYTNAFNNGILDSNYLFNPYNSERIALRVEGGNQVQKSFLEWQNDGNDLNSIASFVSWVAPTNDSQFFMNQSDDVVTVNLGTTKYLNLDSVEVCSNLTLQPYSSVILINTGEICESNGIQESNLNHQITIYPNPANDIVKIGLGNQTLKKIELFSTNGQKVLESDENEFSISNLKNGIYFVSVNTNQGIIYSKLIKE